MAPAGLVRDLLQKHGASVGPGPRGGQLRGVRLHANRAFAAAYWRPPTWTSTTCTGSRTRAGSVQLFHALLRLRDASAHVHHVLVLELERLWRVHSCKRVARQQQSGRAGCGL